MGQPKLLLPWRGENGADVPLIDKVLMEWTSSRVSQVIVVVRRNDRDLRLLCEGWPVTIVQPKEAPIDMKESIQIGLKHIETHLLPADVDRCFIAPADIPNLNRNTIDQMISQPLDPTTIIVPQFGDRTGHPVLLPWPMTREIFDLRSNEGVNRVIERHARQLVKLPAEQLTTDIDTPEQYELARKADTAKRASRQQVDKG